MGGESIVTMQAVPPLEGGAIPTSPLQLSKHEWRVENLPLETARHLVKDYHYSRGASNTATYLHGLFPKDWHWYAQAVGCAWWIPPTKTAARAQAGDDWQGVLALSRLVIQPNTPKNAASFLLSKSMFLIDRERWPVLVTYADEWQGHTGAIYRATGWQYDGLTGPQPTYVKNGVMIARKRGNITRTHAGMIDIGAEFIGKFRKHRFVHRQESGHDRPSQAG